jgi:hypothetical protein
MENITTATKKLSNSEGRISTTSSAQEAELPEYQKEAIIARLKGSDPCPF